MTITVGYPPANALTSGSINSQPVVPVGANISDAGSIPVMAKTNPLTEGIEILLGDETREVPCVQNLQSSVPVSLVSATTQKTILVIRIPPEKLSPGCRVNLDFEFSRNRTGAASIGYGIYLNDYFSKAVGQGEQSISVASLATTSQDTRRERATVMIGADLRHQKFLQNNASNGGMGNLNKYLDCNYNGNKGLAILIAATPTNAADVFTVESYKIEVTK